MRKYVVEIDLDNDAFGDTPQSRGAEVARLLRALADYAECGLTDVDEGTARDRNGNTVLRAYVNYPPPPVERKDGK